MSAFLGKSPFIFCIACPRIPLPAQLPRSIDRNSKMCDVCCGGAAEDRGAELRMYGYDLASVLAEMQEVSRHGVPPSPAHPAHA
jgi:hypothetical protein